MIETSLFLWLALSAIVGVAANTRGRAGLGWFVLAILISPLLAGLLVLALRKKEVDYGPVRVSRSERDRA